MHPSGRCGPGRWLLPTLMTLALSLSVTPGWASSPGQQLWVDTYDGSGGPDSPERAAVDKANGNVYVTGTSRGPNGSDDYATVAYTAAGVRLWAARYDGPDHGADYAAALAVEPNSGNVYVAGTSLSGTSGRDYATVAYSAAGEQLWAARYNGPGNGFDEAADVAVDPGTGTVYVTGQSATVPGDNDFATIAYSPAGARLGVARYDGPAGEYDRATALAVNPISGNVYVAGPSTGVGSYFDYATVAYSRTGARLWVARYDGPSNGNDFFAGLAVDPGSGTVYVTGSSQGVATSLDYATVAYSATGAQLWANRYSSDTDASSDNASAVAVDPGTGNVYVTGGVPGRTTNPFDHMDYATAAYSAAGASLWVRRYNSPINGRDLASSLAIDTSNGNVYVTGSSAGFGANDFVTAAYGADGSRLWVSRYANSARQSAGAVDVAVDPGGGNVYVTGTAPSGAGTGLDYTTVAYAGSQGLPVP